MFTFVGVSRAIVLSTAVLLFGCKKEEGAIGPKGDPGAAGPQGAVGPQGPTFAQAYEKGFIKGTIKGKRRDGTAFEEAFEYKIAGESEGFAKKTPMLDELSLSRSQDLVYGQYVNLNLLVENKGQANQAVRLGSLERYSDLFRISFQKQLPNNQLFTFRASALFEPTNIVFPVSREKNAVYKFVDYGREPLRYQDDVSKKIYYAFDLEDGGKVHFGEEIINFNTEYKFAYVVSNAGVKSTTSTTYGNLRYDYDNNLRTSVFFVATTSLHEVVAVPADTYAITNFAHNATTGLVTFDYKLTIEALRSNNSSLHPVEITGSVSATVYNSSVMRRSGE